MKLTSITTCLLLAFALLIGGCSLGSVKEYYDRSGPNITSIGEGYYEFEVWQSEDGTTHMYPIEIPAPKFRSDDELKTPPRQVPPSNIETPRDPAPASGKEVRHE